MDPVADIGVNCTDEEIIMHLEKMMTGSPAPSNVMTDVNPYIYHPSNLPDGIWYLIRSEEKSADSNEHGLWIVEGEAGDMFSNSSMIGSMTLLEFYEGKFPHAHKTDWLMEEFRIIEKIPTENKAKEAGSLCRVFRCGARQILNDDNQGKMSSTEENGDLAGNYLELLDLYNPPLPCCWRCLTMSSDEYFDPMDFLRQLDSENNQESDMSPATSDR